MPKPAVPKSSPLHFCTPLKEKYSALIALPSFNESSSLPSVIKSLEENESAYTNETLIVINVNNRSSADNEDNLKTLTWLNNYNGHLHISWLNNAEAPFSYPEKFGVGLARHQAVTAGSPYIENISPVISLDGDSPVSKNYLEEIFNAFTQGFNAGHVNFKHRQEGTNQENRAIQLYDQHLHLHRQRLEGAGSPHAWYAIGSTIVCSKKSYEKAGGYNVRRMAGEDFYLLQQLSKTGCEIQMIENAWVYPSNRASDRVPFGTGKAVADILVGGTWHTYSPKCYDQLKELLASINAHTGHDAGAILDTVSSTVKDYLTERNFEQVWARLQSNSRDDKMLRQRFHEWFDAFQTLKLIHKLTDELYPKEEIL